MTNEPFSVDEQFPLINYKTTRQQKKLLKQFLEIAWNILKCKVKKVNYIIKINKYLFIFETAKVLYVDQELDKINGDAIPDS